jgi:hypothetical protein
MVVPLEFIAKLAATDLLAVSDLNEEERKLLGELFEPVVIKFPWLPIHNEYMVLKHEYEDLALGDRSELSMAFERTFAGKKEYLVKPNVKLKDFTKAIRLDALRHSDLFNVSYNT